MNTDDTNKLYIPVNIKTRTEFFNGFGTSELGVALVVAVISTIICVVLYLTHVIGVGTAVVTVVLSIAAIITFTMKNSNNISVIGHVSFLIQFFRLQKKYKYIYKENLLL